jgi:hypothetical protein
MKLPDANVILYAVNEDAPHHARAKDWFERTLSSSEPVGFEWSVLLAFLRVSTKASLFPRPLKPRDAIDYVDSWLAQPAVRIVHPGERHARLLRDLLGPLGAGGNLVSDAHLAAVAIEHGAELCSCDGDFGRFPGLRWTNPLA